MSELLLDRLDATASRVRSVAVRATIAWTVAAAVGSAVLLVGIDWIGRFSDGGLRWVFSAALALATASCGVAAWRRLAPRDASRLGVALRLERVEPRLGSRLASAVEFAAGHADDPTAGSADLRRAVVVAAASEVDRLPFESVIDWRPLRVARRWLGVAVGAGLLLGLLAGPSLATGVYRLVFPWAHAPWPRLVSLRVVEAPTTLARGAAFEATVENESGPLPPDARVEYRFLGQPGSSPRAESAPAQLVGDLAIASRARVERPFSFRFVGGDDDTMAWTDVAVLDPPVAETYSVRITPPAHSGLAPSDSSGALRVLAGSALEFTGRADKELAAATLSLPGAVPVTLAIDADRRTFRSAAPWAAEATAPADKGAYGVRLEGVEGVAGEVGPHRYEAVADAPPEVEWRGTEEGDGVTARALVPLAGQASDDLAIAAMALEWSLDSSAEASDRDVARDTIEDRGESPPARQGLEGGDAVEVSHEWDLEPLALEPGDEVLVWLVATDYKPQEGRTPTPRSLRIVTDEEFLARLAERQSRLLGLVQQALTAQRDAAGATLDLAADSRTADTVDRERIDRLTAIEFQQREAASSVDDPTVGAAATAERLRDDLARSRLESPELTGQLAAAAAGLRAVAEGPVSAARAELAAARRAGERVADPRGAEDFRDRLDGATREQREAVDRLEQVADLLTSWADFQRFAGEAAALEKLERQLAAESQRQAVAAASRMLSGATQAERDKLVAAQAEAARRFDRLRTAMQRLLSSQPEGSTSRAADSVGDALAEADDADVTGDLREAALALARGKLGAGSQAQQGAADGLRAMVEALRQQTITDPAELARRLADERRKLEGVEREVRDLQQRPETRQTAAERRQTAERAARLGRRLERLTAPAAAASAARGAQQTGGGGPAGGSPREQLGRASESFAQAQREVARRIRELDSERTQRLLDQLAERIGGYIARQQEVLDGTTAIDGSPPSGQLSEAARKLATVERAISEELDLFAKELGKRAVFEIALGGAATQTSEAADRLTKSRVDRVTQRFEASALRRLQHIEEVLQQTPPPQPESPPGQGGGGGGGGNPPPPSPIDVAELKMLRLMQLEVLGETDAYEADTAQARRSGEPLPADWEGAGAELARRQRRLAELALELSQRDNDPEEGDPDAGDPENGDDSGPDDTSGPSP